MSGLENVALQVAAGMRWGAPKVKEATVWLGQALDRINRDHILPIAKQITDRYDTPVEVSTKYRSSEKRAQAQLMQVSKTTKLGLTGLKAVSSGVMRISRHVLGTALEVSTAFATTLASR